MHAYLGKSQGQMAPRKDDDQTNQIKEDDIVLVLPGNLMTCHGDDGKGRDQIDGDDGKQNLEVIVNGQQIDQDEHEQVFKEETAPVLVLKKVRHARDELMNKKI